MVLSVAVPPGRDLGAIVARADPSGRLATAVDSYVGVSGATAGQVTLGVDPARFARIAYWPRELSIRSAARLTAGLHPRAAQPIVLKGDALRLTASVASLSIGGEQVYADMTTGASPVTMGTLPRRGPVTLTAPLTGCPCVLQNLALTLSGRQIQSGALRSAVSGSLTISALQVHDHGQWRHVGQGALGSAANWRDPTSAHPAIAASPSGLTWLFANIPGTTDPTLAAANTPALLPAIITAPLFTGDRYSFAGTGFDGRQLRMRPLAVLPGIPGAAGNGVLVDRHYAELAAGEDLSRVGQQVWLAAGALPLIKPRLLASGVRIVSERMAGAVTAKLGRQGPGLASVLFLADAAAAAALAAGAAILGLYVSARRRRYEYAALEASGVSRRSLRAAVLLELAVVLGFGTVTGVATGLAAAILVLRSVPEFVRAPVVPPLSYVPPVGPVAAMLGGAVALLASAAVVASITLIRSVNADELREAPE